MSADRARLRLLIIDDEERILTALKSLFRNTYHVFATTDGHKALDFLQRYQMHVIISDQRMPIMTGVELLRQSAAAGSTLAQFALGVRLIEGMGMPRDQAQGMKLVRQSASLGNLDAQIYLRELVQ